jgi:hypothetical protein
MAIAEVTIADMAKNKGRTGGKGSGEGGGESRKPNRSPSYTIYARIRPDLGEAFERYLNSLRPKPTQVKALEALLEDALGELGFWTAPGAEDDGTEGGGE